MYYFVIELIVKCVDYWNPLDDEIGKLENNRDLNGGSGGIEMPSNQCLTV